MPREIEKGSWVHVKLPGRWKFTAEVKRVHADGSIDVTDPKTGHARTVRPDACSPARKPKALHQ